ncbi:MFS transporter [Jatrophihabitans sp.]|uniref:MFS transporter n=1 Tax=Jatrophihabitans sp. TaxID=1932789 RepID=UPI002BD3E118|nr:MFS transporter [Jatrophihabitans sp.]
MLNRYRAAFSPPGTAEFATAGFLARITLAIYPIAIVLIISARTHSYGYAGVVSGSYVVGGALGNPIAAVLVDRLGQHRVLPWFLLAHLASTALFGGLVTGHAPLWTLLPPAVLMGITMLNIGALVRARWSYVWPGDGPERSTGYSVESTLDEVIFVIGPLIATVLALHTHPLVTLGLALLVISIGTLWLATLRSTEPPVQPRPVGERHDFALRYRGMSMITCAMVFMGAVFGSAEVTMVAFCGQHGHRSSAGWVVASFAGGSMVSALFYGGRHWRSGVLRRFVISAALFGVMPFLYFAATGIGVLALCAGVIGLGIAPTLIGAFGLVDQIVPPGSLTEGLTWIGTGLSVGYGLGAAVVGGIADRHGARFAFSLPVGCALASAVFALLLAARLRTPGRPAPVEVGAAL